MIHQFNIPNNPHKHRQYCTILDDVYLTHHNKDTSDGSAAELISITHDGKLVKAGIDKDTQKLGNKEIYYENKFNDITKYDELIDENIFLLYDDAGVNYLHSFFDLFGRCIYFDILVKEKPIKLGLSEEFWTDSGKNDFIKQWLKLYYGDNLDVVIFKKGKTYKINQITLSNCLYWSPEYTGHQPIMELIKKTVEKVQPIKVNSNGCYISRQDTIKYGWFHPREMANELELIDKIKCELNYDIIELMNYNLIEKIQIFKSYKNIIQQSSASNVNILFSPKGINNIILTNPKLGPWLNPKCQDFSSTSGCNLLILEDIGELILDSTQPNEGDLNNFPWRITDIDGVISILKQIDNYQLFIHQLKRNLNYLDHDIIFNPCLNLSNYFYDWENSILNSEFFTHKFNELNKIVENKVILNSVINFEDKILGALDYKRDFLQKYKNEVDAFIWFDSDMIFPDDTLFYLINSFEEVNHNKCIITPQITRLWDTSWDILVNEQYLNRSLSFETYADFDGYDLYTPTGDKTLIENPIYTKFASGWCNLLSSTLFKEYIEYPKRLGHYGKDDTFAMFVLDMYKKKGHDIKQFIIQNLIVTENNKFKISSYDDLVTKNINVKSKEIFRQESEDGMNYELNQLYNKINKL